MVLKLQTAFVFLFLPYFFYGQMQETEKRAILSTRLGLNTFNEINLYVNPLKKGSTELSLGVGWKFGPNPFDGCGSIDPVLLRQTLSQKGGILRIGIDQTIFDEFNRASKFSLYLEGRFIKVEDFVIDEGCFSGTSGAPYEKYDWKAKDILLRFFKDHISRNGTVNFYWSVALGGGQRTKDFETIGTFGNQIPSDRVDENWEWVFGFDLGFRIAIIRGG